MGTVTKTYTIHAKPQEVYNALINEDLIEQWSGTEATMDIKPNGLFSLWGGSIHGINLEVSPTKIVQHWKEEVWDDYSKCTFTITEKDGLTELHLLHEDIPESSVKDIDGGWDDYYLGPLKELLEE
jgi:activator of HSP90 ATPase